MWTMVDFSMEINIQVQYAKDCIIYLNKIVFTERNHFIFPSTRYHIKKHIAKILYTEIYKTS